MRTPQEPDRTRTIAGAASIVIVLAAATFLSLQAEASRPAPLDLAATIHPHVVTVTAGIASPQTTGTANAINTLRSSDAQQTAVSLTQAEQTAAAYYPTQTAAALESAAQAEQIRQILSAEGISTAQLPFEWPMKPFDPWQIQAARECDIETLYRDRYDALDEADYLRQRNPQTACDWAVLATAYTSRSSLYPPEPAAEPGRLAYQAAIASNPALTLKSWLFYGNFGPGLVVKAPPFTRQPVESVMITFTRDSGFWATSTVMITHADTDHPAVGGWTHKTFNYDLREGETPPPLDWPAAGTVDPALVQALGQSLIDLVPIRSQFTAEPCTDNYPDWQIVLVYADGTAVTLDTNHSNVLDTGGPWEAHINGQDYIHVSSAIPSALNALVRQLRMPQGASARSTCSSQDMIDYAYPPQ